MHHVISDFNERVTEVEQFLKVLDRLEKPSVVLYDKATRREKRVFHDGSLKIMKASVFLLIYNVVESTIRSSFKILYSDIKNKNISATNAE